MSIVLISTYPVSTPLHGGQRRVAAILGQGRAAGLDMHSLPIFFDVDFPEATADERATALPAALRTPLFETGRRQDLHLAQVLDADHPAVQTALARLRALAPRVIAFESPWLHPVLGPAIAADPVLAQAKIVYSSQNVEADLMPAALQDEALTLETALVAAADLVIAVSASDAAIMRGWRAGADRPAAQNADTRIIVAPNGATPPDPPAAGAAPAIAERYALFTGSAHQPNATGYWDCIGTVPGFLPPGTRLVIAGAVNNMLGGDLRFQRFRRLNADLVENMGVVSEATLRNLLQFAHAICLPVTAGGGTNLKTAEALLSGKPIVAMARAFRGFEAWIDAPGVHIATDTRRFRHLMREVMTADPAGPGGIARDTTALTWAASLAPLIAAYGALAPRASAHPDPVFPAPADPSPAEKAPAR